MNATYTRWTDSQIAFLRDNYNQMSFTEIAQRLGKTPKSIKAKAFGLKLFSGDSLIVGEHSSEVTVAEAAQLTDRLVGTLTDQCRKGKIPGARKIPDAGAGQWMIPRTALSALSPRRSRRRPKNYLLDHDDLATRTLVLTLSRSAVDNLLEGFQHSMPPASTLDEVRLIIRE